MKAYGLARLGRDAEVRYTPQGTPVANLSLAFSFGRKGSDGKRPTQWVDASLWGDRADSLAQYLTKGAAIVVTLSDVHIQTYQGRNGDGHKLVGTVDDIEFAGGQRDDQAGNSASRPAPAPAARPAAAPRTGPAGGGSGFDDMDDDIPFE